MGICWFLQSDPNSQLQRSPPNRPIHLRPMDEDDSEEPISWYKATVEKYHRDGRLSLQYSCGSTEMVDISTTQWRFARRTATSSSHQTNHLNPRMPLQTKAPSISKELSTRAKALLTTSPSTQMDKTPAYYLMH